MGMRPIFGTVLVLLGAILFLNRGGTIGTGTIFEYFWPSLFVVPVGLFFHWLYFSMLRRGVGLLVPGGIVLTAGVTCQAAMLTGGWSYLWPGFVLSVAVGLFELYWFGSRNRWLLLPISVLTVIALLFFAVFGLGAFLAHVSNQPILAVLLIAVGAIALLSQRRKV